MNFAGGRFSAGIASFQACYLITGWFVGSHQYQWAQIDPADQIPRRLRGESGSEKFVRAGGQLIEDAGDISLRHVH